MGRKRRGPKGPKDLHDIEKPKKKVSFKEAEEDPEDYMYDEVEKFHLQKDKLLLNYDDELSESGDELEEEEVLALPGSSDEDENEGKGEVDEQESDDEDLDDRMFEEPDDEIPSNKAWGKRKKTFYDRDVKDDDVYASDEEAERAAQEEEEEALKLQKRMFSSLDENDFSIIDEVCEKNIEVTKKTGATEAKVYRDLSKMTSAEKIEILVNESPELPFLIDEYQEKLDEIKDTCSPLFTLTKKEGILSPEGIEYVRNRYRLLLNYCVYISFYLYLKSKQQDLKDHPVIGRILQHQKLLEELEAIDERLRPEIKQVLQETGGEELGKSQRIDKTTPVITSDELKKVKQSEKKKTSRIIKENNEFQENPEGKPNIDPLEYYNQMKLNIEQGKAAKRKRNIPTHQESDSDDLVDEEAKRGITYEMAKNKGLTRKRRKELKNPRLKHRMKFKKALIKRKSQVREVVSEFDRYGGEMTGIKANLTKSVKIK